MGCVHTEKEEGSMAALKGLKPEKVFEYFEKLCSVPHGSCLLYTSDAADD